MGSFFSCLAPAQLPSGRKLHLHYSPGGERLGEAMPVLVQLLGPSTGMDKRFLTPGAQLKPGFLAYSLKSLLASQLVRLKLKAALIITSSG